jgi:hypothetical protein
MEIARGSADAARWRADVRDDHSSVAKILDDSICRDMEGRTFESARQRNVG